MANFTKYFYGHVLNYEIGYVADDNGHGQQKWGVVAKWWLPRAGLDLNKDGTINADDIKLLTKAQAAQYTKKYYWDYFKADAIKNQSIAEIITDFGFVFGVGKAANSTRKILGINPNTGALTTKELAKINAIKDQAKLFENIKKTRKMEADNQTQNQRFFKGWDKRFNQIQFIPNKAGIALITVIGVGLGIDYAVRGQQSLAAKGLNITQNVLKTLGSKPK